MRFFCTEDVESKLTAVSHIFHIHIKGFDMDTMYQFEYFLSMFPIYLLCVNAPIVVTVIQTLHIPGQFTN